LFQLRSTRARKRAFHLRAISRCVAYSNPCGQPILANPVHLAAETGKADQGILRGETGSLPAAGARLLLLIQAALGWLAVSLGWSTFNGWVVALVSIYTVWYVYRAMRVYYGQGRLLTLAKLCAVGFTYMIGFSITLFVTFLFSAIIA